MAKNKTHTQENVSLITYKYHYTQTHAYPCIQQRNKRINAMIEKKNVISVEMLNI